MKIDTAMRDMITRQNQVIEFMNRATETRIDRIENTPSGKIIVSVTIIIEDPRSPPKETATPRGDT